MSCENFTNCVSGQYSLISCAVCGMLLRGDAPPANRFITIYTGSISIPNCPIVDANVAIMMPSDATENRNNANPTA